MMRMIGCPMNEYVKRLERGDERGFTLVELIVVVAILGLLMLLAIPSYSQYVDLARADRAEADIRTLEKEITAYAIDNGRFPNGLGDIGRDTLMDPWGNPYGYHDLTQAGATFMEFSNGDRLNTNKYFDVFSKGKDGTTSEGVYDDTCADDIALLGDGGDVAVARRIP